MALKATCYLILLAGNLDSSLAAPAHDDLRIKSLISVSSVARPQQSLPPLEQRSRAVKKRDIEHLELAPPTLPQPSTISSTNGDGLSSVSFPISSAVNATITITATEEVPTTVTITQAPVTITEIITATSSSISSAPSSTSTPPGFGPAKSIWVAPADLSDLSSFQISKFASGEDNLEIVSHIPAKAHPSAAVTSKAKDVSILTLDAQEPTAAMQLLFPAGSINPAQKPVGGAEFYGSPMDISTARNVTLRYSVMFPANFDWVLAGKLPGLYGGHAGCSGGNAALDCFSTRMMWRQDGAGELYLYAPKDKQTDALCGDKLSVCDAAYGLSVGRGSFFWKAGGWTTIHQTVALNTPGKQDGVFTLDVDGKTVIHRNDVFYREDLNKASDDKGTTTKTTKAATKTTSTKHSTKPKTTSYADGDILGPLLGGLLGGLRRENVEQSVLDNRLLLSPVMTGSDSQTSSPNTTPQPTASNPQPTPTAMETPAMITGIESTKDTEVKFAGIFFSTFFGGHEDKYATPKDQYVWFKDFALAYNS